MSCRGVVCQDCNRVLNHFLSLHEATKSAGAVWSAAIRVVPSFIIIFARRDEPIKEAFRSCTTFYGGRNDASPEQLEDQSATGITAKVDGFSSCGLRADNAKRRNDTLCGSTSLALEAIAPPLKYPDWLLGDFNHGAKPTRIKTDNS